MLNRTRILALLIAVVLGTLIVPAALAATVETGEDFVVDAGDVVSDDVYAFADEVRIEGTIEGDLIAGASTVTIAEGGRVEGDLIAAGREVVIEGEVGDDVRVAAFEVSVAGTGSVGSDFLAAGYSVECGPDTAIGGDVLAVGYQGIFDGIVDGDLRFAGSALQINGQVGGDVRAEVDAPGDEEVQPFPFAMFGMPEIDTIEPGLTIGDAATIEGTLVYTAPQESDLPDGIAASVDYNEREVKAGDEDEDEAEDQSALVKWLIHALKTLVALLVVGLVALLALPRAMQAADAVLRARPLPSAGWGCLTLIVAFVGLIVLVFATVLLLVLVGVLRIGPLVPPILSAAALIGTILTAGVYLLGWVGRIVVSLRIGRGLLGLGSERWSSSLWLPLLLGALIYAVLWAIPWVGAVFDFIGVLFGLGSLVIGARSFVAARRFTPPPQDTLAMS